MNVTLKIVTQVSKNGKNYDTVLLTTKTGLQISIVDFNAVQRVRDIQALCKSLGVPLEKI